MNREVDYALVRANTWNRGEVRWCRVVPAQRADIEQRANEANRRRGPHATTSDVMIVAGLLLLLLGFLVGSQFIWTLGVIVLVIGLVLWILGSLGRGVGGRRHYF